MQIIKSLFFVAATAVAPLSWSLSYDALGLDALPPAWVETRQPWTRDRQSRG